MMYRVFRRPFTDFANLPMSADAFAAVRLRDMVCLSFGGFKKGQRMPLRLTFFLLPVFQVIQCPCVPLADILPIDDIGIISSKP